MITFNKIRLSVLLHLFNYLLIVLLIKFVGFCRIWKFLLIMLVFYIAWICPFEIGLVKDPTKLFFIINWIVTVLFAIDMFVSSRLVYIDETTYEFIDDPRRILCRYVRTRLFFDITPILLSLPRQMHVHVRVTPAIFVLCLALISGEFNLVRLYRRFITWLTR